jgi:diaminohydroxyphosphoribosylaminopyrimidine deaminase/5-amino-6-(5-phosphoribosylamino)uracil reductase
MNSQEIIDIKYMEMALDLAKRGMGTVAPNPMVGAVVVKNNIILGKGWHVRPGEPHAEPNAIADCEESCEGATIYVTLEPCCHTNKRTPPCTNAILQNKFKRVVIATLDPNPNVAGNGVKILEDAGIEVVVGILEKESQQLNEIFFKNILTKTPYVHLKMAQTLDGKLSTMSGDSKWITDENARTLVHQMRLQYDAVMVGRKTLNNDDPSLNIRMGIDSKGKTPFRIVVGNIREIDFNAKIFNDENTDKTIVLTSIEDYQKADEAKIKHLTDKKVQIVFTSIKEDKMDIEEGFKKLGDLGITSILVEGGGGLASSLLERKLVDKATVFVAPKVIGSGIGYYNKSFEKMSDALNFTNVQVKSVGNQAMFEMYPE